MSIYLKIAAVCVGIMLLQIWNLWRSRRLGRIFLGALQYDRETSPKVFRIAFVVNILWLIIVLSFLLFCCVRAAGADFNHPPRDPSPPVPSGTLESKLQLVRPPSNPPPPVPRGPESRPLPDGILAFNTVSNETRVIEGEPQAHFTFDFTNLSHQAVTILAVDTSCACTTVETPPLPWTVGPQATGKIPVVMDVEHETGRDLETVTLTTPQGLKELTVLAMISPASTNADKAGPH